MLLLEQLQQYLGDDGIADPGGADNKDVHDRRLARNGRHRAAFIA
jgi:hypothetical protein